MDKKDGNDITDYALRKTLQIGFRAHLAGKLRDAEAIYRRVIEANPNHADANHLLGMIAYQLGRHEDAVALISTAIRCNATVSAYHLNLGNVLMETGRLDDAIASYRAAMALSPNDADIHFNLGSALREKGQLDDAIASLRKAVIFRPNDADIHSSLGNILKERGFLDEAVASYRRSLEISPNSCQVYVNLGFVEESQGRLEEAIASYRRALKINPNFAEALNNLGGAMQAQGMLDDAIESYRRAIVIKPDYAEAHYNMGEVARHVGNWNNAIESYTTAIAIKPNFAEAYNNLGLALHVQGMLDKAVASCRKALAARQNYADAHNNLGAILMEIGELKEAIAHFEKALTINPNLNSAQKNYLHCLLYLPDLNNADLFKSYRQIIGAKYKAKTNKTPVRRVRVTSNSRLRIGYLSSDFNDHPVGHNVLPLIGNHDHEHFEIFCYSTSVKNDTITERFRGYAEHWADVTNLTDAQVASQIRKDGIDVMVYLGGYFDKNRPAIATHRPAEVQVSMHGGSTTALADMDYWLTDLVLHPKNSTERYTERLFHLPNFYAYPIPENSPPISRLPADDNGFVTFASFNKPCKFNDRVVDLWSNILRLVPNSRLVLKYRNYLESPFLRKKLLSWFERKQIPEERVILLSSMDNFHDHMKCYNQVDIALDTFPFAGATTTFQALWMGVPVISLMGDRFISRMGGSLSVHLNLSSLVVEEPGDYVAAAVALANDRPRLREIRLGLRKVVMSSSLCDGPTYARAVEKAYVAMRKRS